MQESGQERKSLGPDGRTDAFLRKQALWCLLAWLVLSAVPAGGVAILFSEHFRRAAILENGERLDARIVTRRFGEARYGRVCRTVYGFVWADRSHTSDMVGCPASEPIGGTIAIAFDPAEPSRSFALAQGTWAGGARFFPFVLLAALAALSWFLLGLAFRALAELRRRG